MSLDSISKSLSNAGNSIASQFRQLTGEKKEPINLITGIALAILGFVLAITGSPVFGTLLILTGAAVALILPNLSELSGQISEFSKGLFK